MVLRKWLSALNVRCLPGHRVPGARKARLNQSRYFDQPASVMLESLEPRQLLTASTDHTAPTPILSTSLPTDHPANASTLPITVTFDEAVTGLTLSDFTITNGTASSLTGSGAMYSFNVTPTTDGVVTINLGNNAVTDLAGNKNHAALALSITVDRSVPLAPAISSPSGSLLTKAASVTVSGSAEAASLVRLYRDVDANGSLNGGDTLVDQQQLGAAQTGFSFSAALTANASNRFLVTAADNAGNQSAAKAAPTITQDSVAPQATILEKTVS